MLGFVITVALVLLFRRKNLGILNYGCNGSGVSEEDLEALWELGFALGVVIESWILGLGVPNHRCIGGIVS